ncbi:MULTISPECIES: phage tail tape measure protein [Pseudomonas]|uniref:Tail tape measure protein n=3 Tax=Pseudomonas TaxID=286 RepID=A0A0N9WPC4_PSEFL|nr:MULTISPECIES: phage tail tape measure protein [Pseudomonas]ALI04574.1 tail tape measure protein [Pseudomonas fluorescens]PMZ02360.1 phage tail tape measure protein [Pseudomonas sp. FW306-02-F02-AB]PMZ09047.1 phage tail tape measure protein [Pseudomonas sp. FW306-02-H06C]PMZ19465.1 phage tail tape measure protein [Pseudomonas sp. FW306-02-F08-AA]PMZ26343.1 phage tail tape measure protein [Pseudomonas sp. FW306-02-F04-BA]
MANKLALGLVIGGAVSSTVGAAFKDVTGRIKRLEDEGKKARVLQRAIGDTIRLRDEWKKAHDSGSAGASKLLGRLNSNLDSLKRQGVEVGRLEKAYRSMGQAANKAEFKAKGHQQLDAGKAGMKSAVGAAVVGVGALVVPTKVSADFGAIVRDIAIKAGVANKPQEQEMSRKIIDTSRDTGMARNDVADVVNQLVGAGMELSKALEYAPVAAKFVVGQGSSGVDTAKMINALGQNAKITDAKQMQQALEAIAYQGQAGSFEAADMAKWFPELLANMGSIGITGMDAVTQLGAMLQVQMKTAGSSDEAANNLKNWMGKIGATDTVQAYKKAGIDYKGSMQTGLQNGMSTLETSMALAQKYIQATDPKRAAAMAEATSKISKEADPEKAKAMMASLEESLKTGDLFADMQVKAALSAYMQNKALYSQLKNDSRAATGILDKNLSERRESSSQKWAEMAQSMDDAMRSVGDALRPVTDTVAETLTKVTKSITALSDSSPGVVTGIVAVGGGLITLKGLFSSFKMGKGLFNLARGSLGGGKAGEVQKVFVTNAKDGDGKDAEPKGKAGKALSLVETGLKAVAALKGKPADGDAEAEGEDDKKAGKFDLVSTGLKVVSLAKEATSGGGEDGEAGSGDDGVKKVFVVNAGAMGSAAEGPGETCRRGRGARRNPSRRRSRPPVPRPPVPVPRPPIPPVPVPSGAMARLGGVVQAVGKIGKAAKMIPGGSLMDAGAMAFETYQTAKTQDEKAEGYGAAAGNLAGTMAGAAAGAAIGSVVPIIGTAIGGLVGAYLGSQGGEALGGSLGKSLFGGKDDKPEEKPAAPITPLLMAPRPGPAVPSLAALTQPLNGANGSGALLMAQATAPQGPVLGDVARSLAVQAPAKPAAVVIQPKEPEKPVPAKVDQQFQYSLSMPVTVQGDVKDPQRLAQDLMPHMQRMMADAAKQNAAKLYDEPHV